MMITGCHHNQEQAFDNLTAAFFQWYYKSNPTIATIHGVHEYSADVERFDKDFMKENLSDLKRFDLELSQIDKAALPIDKRVDYSILAVEIERLIYARIVSQEYLWNPAVYHNIIRESILHSIKGNTQSPELGNVLIHKLSEHIRLLSEAELNISQTTEIHKKQAMQIAEENIRIIQDLPLEIVADNTILDQLDLAVAELIKTYWLHQHWLENLKSDLDSKLSIESYLDRFNLLTNQRYVFSYFQSAALEDLIFTQNEMFIVTYPFYLQENDEPVWVSRQDTLDVIQWGVDNIFEKEVNPEYLVDETTSGLEKLSEHIHTNQLFSFSRFPNLQVKLSDESSDSYLHSDLNLFGANYSRVEGVYELLMSDPEGTEITDPVYYHDFNHQSLALMNILEVIPGAFFQIGSLREHLSFTRMAFQDALISAGWRWYAAQVIVDSGYEMDDYRTQLELLRKKLGLIEGAILEFDLYTGIISTESARELLVENGFQTEYEAARIVNAQKLNPMLFTSAYLGERELQYLLQQMKSGQKEKFNPSSFHDMLFSEGLIPYPELQTLLLD